MEIQSLPFSGLFAKFCSSKRETLIASQKMLWTEVRKVWRKCGFFMWFDPFFHHKPKARQDKMFILTLSPFSLISDFGKQNTCGNVSKILVSLACYWQIGSKSTNYSPIAWRREGQKVTLVAAIGGFRSDLSITGKTDGKFGNVSAGVFVSQSHVHVHVSTKTMVMLYCTSKSCKNSGRQSGN